MSAHQVVYPAVLIVLRKISAMCWNFDWITVKQAFMAARWASLLHANCTSTAGPQTSTKTIFTVQGPPSSGLAAISNLILSNFASERPCALRSISCSEQLSQHYQTDLARQGICNALLSKLSRYLHMCHTLQKCHKHKNLQS